MHCFIQCNNKNKGQFLKITPSSSHLEHSIHKYIHWDQLKHYCQSNLNSLYHTIRLLHSGSKMLFPCQATAACNLNTKSFVGISHNNFSNHPPRSGVWCRIATLEGFIEAHGVVVYFFIIPHAVWIWQATDIIIWRI